jgi:carboxylesterase type B
MLALLSLVLAIQVQTPCGPVTGGYNDTFNVFHFLGIPFGVIPQRFQHSTVAQCWGSTPIDATSLGPSCYQMYVVPPQGQSEDCLNLNIYVPANSSGLLPVMLYVYGGGNLMGDNYQGGALEELASLLDIVIVVPNFRLGVLGYLVHEASGMYGNYGIGDVITALEFVRPLLASFNGDANRITLMGQSSGGTNILALLASPRAVGLFAGAISLSGSPNITQDVSTASSLHGKYIIPATGCSDNDELLECLLALSAENLTYSMSGVTGPPPSVNPPNLPFSPDGNELIGLAIVDGQVLTMPVLDAVQVPIVDVSLLVQTVECETNPSDPSVDNITDVSDYASWLQQFLAGGGWSNSQSLSKSIVQVYAPFLQQTVELGFEAFLADLGVTCGNDAIAAAAAASFASPVYRSHLLAPPSHVFPGDRRYAFHTWDFPVSGVNFWGSFEPEQSDLELGALIRSTWRDMVKRGNIPTFYKGGCTAIVVNGTQECDSASRCKTLNSLGFDASFWWVN